MKGVGDLPAQGCTEQHAGPGTFSWLEFSGTTFSNLTTRRICHPHYVMKTLLHSCDEDL